MIGGRIMSEIIQIMDITSECSGPVEKRGKESLPLMDPTSEGTIIKKWQKCGKDNCSTCKWGKGHGPYLWRVLYDPLTKKQTWKYIKKSMEK